MNLFKLSTVFLIMPLIAIGPMIWEVAGDEISSDIFDDSVISDTGVESNAEPGTEQTEVTQEQVDYAKGSVCGYCSYCKFCKLCDEDCPCETSPSKPNCKMCKYCKYCYLCSAICDTICTPGGFIDRVSSSIVSSLPSVNHEEVDSDIESVKTWIDRKKDEL